MSNFQLNYRQKKESKSWMRQMLKMNHSSSSSSLVGRGIEHILVDRVCNGHIGNQPSLNQLLSSKIPLGINNSKYNQNISTINSETNCKSLGFYYMDQHEVASVKEFFYFYKLLSSEKNNINRQNFNRQLNQKNEKVKNILQNSQPISNLLSSQEQQKKEQPLSTFCIPSKYVKSHLQIPSTEYLKATNNSQLFHNSSQQGKSPSTASDKCQKIHYKHEKISLKESDLEKCSDFEKFEKKPPKICDFNQILIKDCDLEKGSDFEKFEEKPPKISDFNQILIKDCELENIPMNNIEVKPLKDSVLDKISQMDSDLNKISLKESDLKLISLKESEKIPLRKNDFKQISLKQSDVERIPLNDSDLQKIPLNDSDLQKIPLIDSDKQKMPLQNSYLQKQQLINSDLQKILSTDNDLQQILSMDKDLQKIPSKDNDLQKIPSMDKDLQKIHLMDKDLQKIPSIDKDLQIIPSKDNDLQKIPSKDNDLQKIPLKNSDLQKISLKDSNVQQIPLKTSDLQKIPLRNSDLQKIPQKNSDLLKIQQKNSDLQKIPLKSNDLQKISLKSNDLQKMSSIDSDIEKISWKNNKYLIENQMQNINFHSHKLKKVPSFKIEPSTSTHSFLPQEFKNEKLQFLVSSNKNSIAQENDLFTSDCSIQNNKNISIHVEPQLKFIDDKIMLHQIKDQPMCSKNFKLARPTTSALKYSCSSVFTQNNFQNLQPHRKHSLNESPSQITLLDHLTLLSPKQNSGSKLSSRNNSTYLPPKQSHLTKQNNIAFGTIQNKQKNSFLKQDLINQSCQFQTRSYGKLPFCENQYAHPKDNSFNQKSTPLIIDGRKNEHAINSFKPNNFYHSCTNATLSTNQYSIPNSSADNLHSNQQAISHVPLLYKNANDPLISSISSQNLLLSVRHDDRVNNQQLKHASSIESQLSNQDKFQSRPIKRTLSIINPDMKQDQNQLTTEQRKPHTFMTMKSMDKFLESHEVFEKVKGNDAFNRRQQEFMNSIFKNATNLDVVLTHKLNDTIEQKRRERDIEQTQDVVIESFGDHDRSKEKQGTLQTSRSSSYKVETNSGTDMKSQAKQDAQSDNLKKPYLIVSQLKEENLLKNDSNSQPIQNITRDISKNLTKINSLLAITKTPIISAKQKFKPKNIFSSSGMAPAKRKILTRANINKLFSVQKYLDYQKNIATQHNKIKKNILLSSFTSHPIQSNSSNFVDYFI